MIIFACIDRAPESSGILWVNSWYPPPPTMYYSIQIQKPWNLKLCIPYMFMLISIVNYMAESNYRINYDVIKVWIVSFLDILFYQRSSDGILSSFLSPFFFFGQIKNIKGENLTPSFIVVLPSSLVFVWIKSDQHHSIILREFIGFYSKSDI